MHTVYNNTHNTCSGCWPSCYNTQ